MPSYDNIATMLVLTAIATTAAVVSIFPKKVAILTSKSMPWLGEHLSYRNRALISMIGIVPLGIVMYGTSQVEAYSYQATLLMLSIYGTLFMTVIATISLKKSLRTGHMDFACMLISGGAAIYTLMIIMTGRYYYEADVAMDWLDWIGYLQSVVVISTLFPALSWFFNYTKDPKFTRADFIRDPRKPRSKE